MNNNLQKGIKHSLHSLQYSENIEKLTNLKTDISGTILCMSTQK